MHSASRQVQSCCCVNGLSVDVLRIARSSSFIASVGADLLIENKSKRIYSLAVFTHIHAHGMTLGVRRNQNLPNVLAPSPTSAKSHFGTHRTPPTQNLTFSQQHRQPQESPTLVTITRQISQHFSYPQTIPSSTTDSTQFLCRD